MTTRLAPAPRWSPPGWPRAMIATPARATTDPAQAIRPKRSRRNTVARIAVMIGPVLTRKLAAPGLTVFWPVLRQAL